MIQLAKDIDYVYMILIAAALGAVGGLGAELLIKRGDDTGTVELPGRLKGTRFVDIGFPASLIIGAIAAAAILYFFPPVVEKVIVGAAGTPPKTTSEYDLVKLVALSLIVGSAGPAFLATAQSRLMSALNAQKVGALAETGRTQVNQLVASATAATPAAVRQAVAEHMPSTDADTVKAIADAASSSLESALAPQAEAAREQFVAVAPETKT